MKNICNPAEINIFISNNPKRNVDHMISVFDNCLEGLPTNPRKPQRKMQQHNDLLSSCFINDFQWRQKRNKGRELVVKNNAGEIHLWNAEFIRK